MKRNTLTYFLLFLRRNGFLCRTPRRKPSKLLISHTVYPDVQLSPIDTEVHVYLQNKKSSVKNCVFNVAIRSCVCGISLDKFGEKGCPNKSNK
jgi:hypothetical protein